MTFAMEFMYSIKRLSLCYSQTTTKSNNDCTTSPNNKVKFFQVFRVKLALACVRVEVNVSDVHDV